MKELTLDELTKTRFTTEFTYGGNCCVDGIKDIAIPNMNAPTYVGSAIDKLKLFEDLYDQGLLAILPHKKSDFECDADEQYIDWLENMLVMLSGNFMELVKTVRAIDEDVLRGISLPSSNETRRAIRLISENAEISNNRLEPEEIDAFTNKVVKKHAKKDI